MADGPASTARRFRYDDASKGKAKDADIQIYSMDDEAMVVEENGVRRAAIDDPDLAPLWDSMGGTSWQKT